MSGHSKWSTIKRAKAATDAKRGALFTKLAKEIIVAAKQGGGDTDANFRLRMAVQRAKDSNMPANNIERAINRGSGADSDDVQMEEITYEGYGPGGTAMLLDVVTDNRNRIGSEVRATFTKSGGNLAEVGAVAWQFEKKGLAVVEADPGETDDLALAAIDAGADDFDTDNGTINIYTAPQNLEEVRRAMEEQGAAVKSAELSMVPNSTVPLDNNTAAQALRLLDNLEELDDVQRVYSNADFPDEVLERYQSEE